MPIVFHCPHWMHSLLCLFIRFPSCKRLTLHVQRSLKDTVTPLTLWHATGEEHVCFVLTVGLPTTATWDHLQQGRGFAACPNPSPLTALICAVVISANLTDECHRIKLAPFLADVASFGHHFFLIQGVIIFCLLFIVLTATCSDRCAWFSAPTGTTWFVEAILVLYKPGMWFAVSAIFSASSSRGQLVGFLNSRLKRRNCTLFA